MSASALSYASGGYEYQKHRAQGMIANYACYSHYWLDPEFIAEGMIVWPGKVVCWIC